jgi:hypothetical protein
MPSSCIQAILQKIFIVQLTLATTAKHQYQASALEQGSEIPHPTIYNLEF